MAEGTGLGGDAEKRGGLKKERQDQVLPANVLHDLM